MTPAGRNSDRRLVDLAKGDHPWIDDIYKLTSGWVHFSPEHIRAAMHVRENQDGTLSIGGHVPIRPEEIPVSDLEGLIGAMVQTTKQLSAYMDVWREKKDERAASEASDDQP